jgi:mitochondrial ATPase complex subunit ATP10
MTNSKVGYVYLIDENLKIRWGGCADPTPKETESLEICTGILLKRLEEIEAKKPKASAKGPVSDSALSSTVQVTA